MRSAALIAVTVLATGLAGCSFTRPLDEVPAPGSTAERMARRERQERAETDRIVRCQSLDRDDPRWDRDCKNRR